MKLTSTAFLCLFLSLCWAFAQQESSPKRNPTTTVSHEDCEIEGHNLEAYEAAANYLRKARDEKTGLPTPLGNISNYTIVFEKPQDECYVMHFLPYVDPTKDHGLGFSLENGMPVRFFVRKKDLKVMKAVLG